MWFTSPGNQEFGVQSVRARSNTRVRSAASPRLLRLASSLNSGSRDQFSRRLQKYRGLDPPQDYR